jgi:membrane fusion protein (multidrug efflux system)
MKRKIIMISTLLVILLMGYFIWTKRSQFADFGVPKSGVIVTQVSLEDMPIQVRALGTLIALNAADLTIENDGVIEALPFPDGSIVKQGDLIIKIEDNIQEAVLAQAQAQEQLTAVDFNRLKSLQTRGAVSKQEFDKSEADMKVAQAQVTLAQAELDKTFIKAPFDGQIGAIAYNVGQYVTSGTPLVNLVDKSKLYVEYSVPQQVLENLQMGAQVSFETSAFPNDIFYGTVNYISPSVDVSTRTLQLQALFDNPNGRLSPGLSGTVLQNINTVRDAMVLPEEVLVPSITGYVVYRVLDGKALATPVEIGARKKGKVQILSGLNAQDAVVIQGQQNLRDGALVKIMEAGE